MQGPNTRRSPMERQTRAEPNARQGQQRHGPRGRATPKIKSKNVQEKFRSASWVHQGHVHPQQPITAVQRENQEVGCDVSSSRVASGPRVDEDDDDDYGQGEPKSSRVRQEEQEKSGEQP